MTKEDRTARRFAEFYAIPEARVLRQAARAFALHVVDPHDDFDSKGQALNRALLQAARAYAKAYEGR